MEKSGGRGYRGVRPIRTLATIGKVGTIHKVRKVTMVVYVGKVATWTMDRLCQKTGIPCLVKFPEAHTPIPASVKFESRGGVHTGVGKISKFQIIIIFSSIDPDA